MHAENAKMKTLYTRIQRRRVVFVTVKMYTKYKKESLIDMCVMIKALVVYLDLLIAGDSPHPTSLVGPQHFGEAKSRT